MGKRDGLLWRRGISVMSVFIPHLVLGLKTTDMKMMRAGTLLIPVHLSQKSLIYFVRCLTLCETVGLVSRILAYALILHMTDTENAL